MATFDKMTENADENTTTKDERSISFVAMTAHCRRIQITGRVQGVGYRASMRRHAQALGLVGWVRNEADGSVQAMAQGSEQALNDLLTWCHKGPPLARVDAVRWEAVERIAFRSFEQIS